ncbi:methyltransferase domain-containing protein [Nannocystaceae bacterium ST9]
MPNCIVCATSTEPVIDFGRMPIANRFLAPDELADEFFFELAVARCPACQLVQLVELVEPARMFHDHYAYFSSTSQQMSLHFAGFADALLAELDAGPRPFVIELGSNDGIMLQHLAARGARVLGVEPSANVAAVAQARGLATHVGFFDGRLADALRDEHGPADAVIGANVLCHIAALDEVFAGVLRLLGPRGLFVFEDPYLPDILERTAFDQFYEEHVVYFRAGSVAALAARHGLELIDVVAQPVHGGSMRYSLAPIGSRPIHARVEARLAHERALGLDTPEPYAALEGRVAGLATRLRETLEQLRSEGKRVMGYGATAKSSTMINYAGIGPALIESICDTTPAKQGRLSPGAHIPVVPHEVFAARPPDVALLFAWNHAREIFAKERGFEAAGGRWLTYLPEFRLT